MKKRKLKIRSIIQIFFFVVIGAIAINHTLAESGQGIPFLSKASLHGLCPFGGVATLYQLATVGALIKKIHASSVILMIIVFFTAILFGPVFCGWVCPLGSIQEWFGKVGKKIFKKRYNSLIPHKLDAGLRYLRYLVLSLVLYMTAISGTLLFSEVDPYHALFSFWTSEVSLISLSILAATLILSLIIERPWCKYLCPYGALLGLTNFIRIFKIRRKESSCIHCKLCDKSCPMNIQVSSKESINNHQCISCLECTSEINCPIPSTVEMSIAKSREREAASI